MRDDMEKIATGRRIKELRTAKGVSAKDLASAAGVSRQAVYMWESGQNGIALHNAAKAAGALGTTLDYLAGLAGRREMNVEDFYRWYKSLDEEDQKLANGLIIISATTAAESDSNTVGEMRKHVHDGFKVLKKEEEKDC